MKTYLRYILIIIFILGFKNASAGIASGSVSNDATLKSIVLSTATTLVYASGPADYNYTTSVSPGTASLTVEPTTNDPNATVTVNGTVVKSGSSSGQLALNGIVTTTISMVVTAQDGVTTHTYSIVVYETGSNDAFLSALSLSTGNTLVAASSGPGTFNYTTSVTVGTSSCAVTPSTADPTATVKVNGVVVTSGSASGSIALNPALNATTTITVTVLAQDGVTTQTYSILVKESGSNNTSLSVLKVKTNANAVTALTATSGTANFNYTTSVKSNTTYVNIKATSADGTATINVNGANATSGAYTTSNIAVPAGGVLIPITVTAQDGVTQQTYAIQVSPNASSGAALTFIFNVNSQLITYTPSPAAPSTTYYTTDIDPSISSITITPTASAGSAGASITVNGVATASGVPSAPITLGASPIVIPLQIVSQDGLTTYNYSVTVNRNGSNNANSTVALNTNTSLVLQSQTPSAISYKTSVPSGLTSVTVTATAVDPNYTSITVNGNPVVSGQASAPIALSTPTTATATVVVTAQDGYTQTTTIQILTTGSNNANLSNISLTPSPTSTYAFVLTSQTATVVNYSVSVNSATTSIAVTPTASDPSAGITYTANGTTLPITSGAMSGSITLAAVGTNTVVTLTVTSPDGTVIKTTNITIARNGSNNANLSSYLLSTNTTPVATTGTANVNTTAAVSPHTISVTVTPVAQDPTSTITVNGLATVSGSLSYPITLTSGSTPILIQVTAPDGVTVKTYSITVTKTGVIYTWTGASGSSWNTAGNWNPAKVPTASDVASFGETAYSGNQPSLAGAANSTTYIGEIYFGSVTPTTLTIPASPAGIKLAVGTNLTVDAGATGAVTSTGATSVYILPGATLNVSGTFNINSNVKFTLQSNASCSASVGPTTAGAIVGNVTVERYIQGGSSVYRGYRLLSSPVYQSAAGGNNIYSVNYIQNSSLITGINPSGGFNKVGNPSLYLFREDVASNNNSFTGGNYWGISTINNTPNYNYNLNGLATIYNIPVANGFFFFFRGDQSNFANKFTAGTLAESVTLSTTGTLNAGPITVHNWFTVTPSNPSTLSYTTGIANSSIRGFNLVGNPYASSIDWDTFSSSYSSAGVYGPNVSGAVYIIDPVSKNYGVYIANSSYGGTNNATHIIPSGQGFFVQASAAGAALTFNESSKTTAQVLNADLLLGTPVASAVNQYLHLKLTKDSVQMDEIFISFANNAQAGYVFGEDAPQKPGFGIASLASMSSDGVALSINKLKFSTLSQSIALDVKASANGNYILNVPEIKSIPQLYDVWLMDAYKKDSVDLRQSPNYSFAINTSDAASYGANRFSIVIRQNTNLTLRLLNFSAAKATNGAQIVWKTVNEQNYTNFTVERSTNNGNSFDDLGGFVSSAEGTYSYLDKSPQITTNLYRLKLVDVNGAVSYSKIVTLQYSTLSDNLATTAVNVYPNPTHGMINLAINQSGSSSFASGYSALQTLGSTPGLNNDQTVSAQSYDIRVFSITGNLVKSAKSTQPTWQSNLSDLQPGTYIIQVLNSDDKSVVGKSTFVKL